jgi:hypothetical protein
LQSRVKIKANKQVTSPLSELHQGETQRETASRLISFWPLLLGVVSFFFPTLPQKQAYKTVLLSCCANCFALGFYKFFVPKSSALPKWAGLIYQDWRRALLPK